MSTGTDLSGSFGRSAVGLTDRLGRNPRRERRERDDQGRGTGPSATEASAPAVEAPPVVTPPEPDEPTGAPGRGSSSTEATTSVPETAAAPGTAEEPRPQARAEAGTATRRSPSSSSGRRGSTARPRGGGRAPQDTDLDANISYQVPVYVHPAVRTAAGTRRKEDKLTNAEIAFNALDEVQHRLPGLIRDRRLQARPENSLFPGRIRRGRLGGGGAASTAGEARRVLWQMRATSGELEIIDGLVERSGAESRSELIAVAMEETLLR